MKIKSWLKYLVYMLLIILMIYIKEYIGTQFTAHYKREFRIDFKLIPISMLIVVGIGLLLGLEHFIREIRKEGRWKINIPKLLLLGLPSLYFSLTYFLLCVNNQGLQNIITYPLQLFRNGLGFVSLFQLIFGYVVITSFYKCETVD